MPNQNKSKLGEPKLTCCKMKASNYKMRYNVINNTNLKEQKGMRCYRLRSQ